MRSLSLLAVLALPAVAFAQKDVAVKSAAGHADANWGAALKIWEWAEPGYQEKKSAEALAEIAEKAGFKVTRGVAKIHTDRKSVVEGKRRERVGRCERKTGT